jgi:molybdopterin converting factor small subunit
MPRVKFTNHLQRFFPDLKPTHIEGATVAEIISALNIQYPGLADYIVDERGVLRKHVNIFVSGELVQDRKTLQDAVGDDDQVFIFQALSGG